MNPKSFLHLQMAKLPWQSKYYVNRTIKKTVHEKTSDPKEQIK